MKNDSSLHDSVNQTVSVPRSAGAEIGLSLLSLALSLCSLVVSCVTLYSVIRLIQLVSPIMQVAQP